MSRSQARNPDPPEGRDAEWLAVWARHCRQLEIMHLGPYAADREALVAFTDATVRYHALAKVALSAPAVVRGVDGQPTVPRVMTELHKAATELLRWATVFGMTPSSRSQLRAKLVGTSPTTKGSDLFSPSG